MALPRSCGGNASSRIACEIGWSVPPVMPCRMRRTTSTDIDGASPHSSDVIVNPAVESSSRRLRPRSEPSQPVIGRMTALAAR